MKLTWYIIVFICGALLPLQTGFNNKLVKTIESPVYAPMISFAVVLISMALYLPFSKESIPSHGMKSTSLAVWLV